MHDPPGSLSDDGQLTLEQGDSLERDPLMMGIRGQIRSGLAAALPDRRLFVLHALASAGYADELSDMELAEVERSAEAIKSATASFSALEGVAAGIVKDREAFITCWERSARVYRLFPSGVWRIAATVVVLIGLGVLYALFTGGDQRVVAVSDGASQLATLPDGSTVLMVGDTEMRYDAENFARHITLDGSAFIEVTRSDAPFTAVTQDAVVTVTGTRFGIKSADGVTEVVLERGSVSVAARPAPDQSVALHPGEMTSVVRGSLPSAPMPVDLVYALDWTGYFFFNATAMSEVAQVLASRFGIVVTLDEALKQEQVSGSFAPGDAPEQILSVLASTLGATVEGSVRTGFTLR